MPELCIGGSLSVTYILLPRQSAQLSWFVEIPFFTLALYLLHRDALISEYIEGSSSVKYSRDLF